MGKRFFSGKVAIVTGASSGVGRETARELAKQGAKIVLAARSTTSNQELAAEILSAGGEAMAVTTDVTEKNQVDDLVKKTLSRYQHVDLLIANAGQYIRSPICNLTTETLERSMAVNFYGGLHAVLAVLPGMLARRTGHIVLVLTMDVKTPLVMDAPYVAAKSALSGFGDVLRQELHNSGVHVMAVYPGRIDTPMIANLRVPWISPKISASLVAREILNGIERNKEQIILPFPAHFLNLLYILSPSLLGWTARAFHLQGWPAEDKI